MNDVAHPSLMYTVYQILDTFKKSGTCELKTIASLAMGFPTWSSKLLH